MGGEGLEKVPIGGAGVWWGLWFPSGLVTVFWNYMGYSKHTNCHYVIHVGPVRCVPQELYLNQVHQIVNLPTPAHQQSVFSARGLRWGREVGCTRCWKDHCRLFSPSRGSGVTAILWSFVLDTLAWILPLPPGQACTTHLWCV